MTSDFVDRTLQCLPPQMASRNRIVVGECSDDGVLHLLTDQDLGSAELKALQDHFEFRVNRKVVLARIDESCSDEFHEALSQLNEMAYGSVELQSEIPPLVTIRREAIIVVGYERRDRRCVEAIIRKRFSGASVVHVDDPNQVISLLACSNQPVSAIIASPSTEKFIIEQIGDELTQRRIELISGLKLPVFFGSEENSGGDSERPLKLVSTRVRTPFQAIARLATRTLALLALIVTLPWLVLIRLILGLNGTKGLGIIGRRCVGKADTTFCCYKIQTLSVEGYSETDHPIWVVRNDPRISGFGRLLRATAIDELPQLYNIVRGDMALIGPRPITKYHYEKICDADPFFLNLTQVMPGLISASSVSYLPDHSMSDARQRLLIDLLYEVNRNVLTDIRLLLGAVFFLFQFSRRTCIFVAGLSDIMRRAEHLESELFDNDSGRESLFDIVVERQKNLESGRQHEVYLDS